MDKNPKGMWYFFFPPSDSVESVWHLSVILLTLSLQVHDSAVGSSKEETIALSGLDWWQSLK